MSSLKSSVQDILNEIGVDDDCASLTLNDSPLKHSVDSAKELGLFSWQVEEKQRRDERKKEEEPFWSADKNRMNVQAQIAKQKFSQLIDKKVNPKMGSPLVESQHQTGKAATPLSTAGINKSFVDRLKVQETTQKPALERSFARSADLPTSRNKMFGSEGRIVENLSVSVDERVKLLSEENFDRIVDSCRKVIVSLQPNGFNSKVFIDAIKALVSEVNNSRNDRLIEIAQEILRKAISFGKLMNSHNTELKTEKFIRDSSADVKKSLSSLLHLLKTV